MKTLCAILTLAMLFALSSCSQETQNKLGRSIQNWTGTDGVLEIYSGGKLMKRFMKVDKLTTASETGGTKKRAYRYGYGKLDVNLNGKVDSGEKRVYFEFSDYSTEYIFYSDPD